MVSSAYISELATILEKIEKRLTYIADYTIACDTIQQERRNCEIKATMWAYMDEYKNLSGVIGEHHLTLEARQCLNELRRKIGIFLISSGGFKSPAYEIYMNSDIHDESLIESIYIFL